MPRRRRRQQGLERVLGTPALFATAYGNVGSSIYYALGVTAAFALGLTPFVFIIAGIIFVATSLTYTEGTVRFPEAGGSSSFARHAFNEVVSFGAAWAQMLNYIITIAISAFFVPHYLSVFWSPLRENPWDIIGGAIVIILLVALNIVGVREAAGLNVFLAVVDFATQLLLVLIGFILILSPETLVENIELGVAPTWSQFLIAIPIGMIAYTGLETISNLAEETRDPPRDVPRAYKWVAGAVFAIYLTLPFVALSALPVTQVGGDFQTKLGLPPEDGGFQNDPILGVVENLGLSGTLLDALEIYVGILAATILFIATNAGVIGASRITYAMASYRQLPEVFRRLHPRFKTPWLSLLVFAGLISILTLLPGKTTFLGTMYSFGAMLSFTIAHAAVVGHRYRHPDEELAFRARPNLRYRGVDWPLFAILGGSATGIAWLVVVVQEPATRWAGLGWLALGFAGYAVYRRWVVREPLAETVRAPVLILGPSLTVEYRTIVVPVVRSFESEEALVAAARLATERAARVAVVHVLEVPLDLPLDVRLPEQVEEANDVLDQAAAIVESYGVRPLERLLRARAAGPAIVEEAEGRNAELIVIGAPRVRPGRKKIFGSTVDYVLRHSHTRVLITAGRRAA
ncbi:MAG TPA: universal stress protein [Gaiellaceae bacterium]|nr:universal stress protein [Gaiellaceae bacterium]